MLTEAAAKEKMPFHFGTWRADLRLAADPHLVENSRHGVTRQNPAPHQGITWSNSTTALGIARGLLGNRVRSRCTGKERDSESGLDYFGARYMSSSMGRFMQPDPKQFSLRTLLNPQKWNKYAYVLNNPLSLVDPDGMEEVTIQVNAYIQKQSVGGFRGDNRGPSANMTTGMQHSRVSVTMRIETDPAKNHGNPLIGKPEVHVGTTHLNLTGSEKTSTGPQMPQVTATQDKNGNVNVNLQESMRNPFTPPGTGSIQTNLNVSVNQNATQAEVSGTVSGSPSFESNFSVDGGNSLNVPLQTEPSSTFGFALGLQETNNVDQKVNLPPPPPKCSDKQNCSQ